MRGVGCQLEAAGFGSFKNDVDIVLVSVWLRVGTRTKVCYKRLTTLSLVAP
jgi:hypothetical protein